MPLIVPCSNCELPPPTVNTCIANFFQSCETVTTFLPPFVLKATRLLHEPQFSRAGATSLVVISSVIAASGKSVG